MTDQAESEFIAFSPDSPLFGVTANDSVNNTVLLAEFLNSIVSKMKDLCESLKQTAIAGNSLAFKMQGAGIGGSSKYTGCVSPIIKHFGGILGGISSSQELLAECLLNTFVRPLEEFNLSEVSKISALQVEYKKEHQLNEDSIMRYLQNDAFSSYTMTRTMNQALLGMKALEVVQQRKKFELARFDFVRGVNAVRAQKSFEIAEACINVLFALRSHHRESSERLLSSSTVLNEMSEQQFEARNKFSLSSLPIDSLRSNMMAVLDTMVERVQTQLPQLGALPPISPYENFQAVDQINLIPDFSSLSMAGADLNVSAAASQAISRLGSMGASFMGGFGTAKPSQGILSSGSFDHERRAVPAPVADKAHAVPGGLFFDIELRMKALDKHQLETFYSPYTSQEYSGLIKQGYLLQRSVAKLLVPHSWSREWFVLDDSKLFMIKEKEKSAVTSLDIVVVCETMLASVRELKTLEVPFVFEISYANRSSCTLQAEGHREYDAWLSAIRGAIEKRLVGNTNNPVECRGMDGPGSKAASLALQRRQENAGAIKEILLKNKLCAECERPDPEWVSLNIGCLMCIECSGVHRSMGVHISKVRSLTLDDLDVEEYKLLMRLGNEVVNSVWEVSVPPSGPKKPRPHDLYPVRDRFIRAKYERRSFVAPLPSPSSAHRDDVSSIGSMDIGATADAGSESEVNEGRGQDSMTPDELLRRSCELDDVIAALRSIAWGANICSAVRSPSVPSPILTGKLSTPRAASPTLLVQDPTLKSSAIDKSSTLSQEQISTDAALVSSDEDLTPKIDLSPSDLTEWSPLLIAAYNGSCACVALLLLSGADPHHAASTLCAESGPSSSTSYKAESIPLMEIAGRAGHAELVAYLHRKLDAMKAVVHVSPSVSPVPSSSSSAVDHLLKEEDPLEAFEPSSSPLESSTVPLPLADESASVVVQEPGSQPLTSKQDQERNSEDELEDFYEALMSDLPTPKTGS